MNKNAIQKFAVWARKEMIAQVSQRAYQYGITKESYGEDNAVTIAGRALTSDEQRQRAELVQQIKIKGYDQVMEEVAYTWFNRFIALRYMEVNNYLPSHIRVFSDANGAFKPEILADVLHLELDGLDKQKVAAYIEQNQTDDLYRYLLLTQCNALNAALPGMFERLGSYTELLLPNNILKADSILGHLVDDIPEEDWTDQVQIIGWLYQYYNEELKKETYALLKKNVKVTKERIPSATQLFTPDWIVRYMVENSLGRLWLDGHPNDDLKATWKYYLDEAEQEADVETALQKIRAEHANIQPQDIKLIDPCMGSGHILVYAFDVLVQIYGANGISQRDAAQSILQHNLYGLDIDDRAAQLAYFAVMMKARQYDRRIFSRGIQPHLYALQNSQPMHEGAWGYFGDEALIARRLWDSFQNAKEFGSLLPLNVTLDDLEKLRARLAEMDEQSTVGNLATMAFVSQAVEIMLPLVEMAEILLQKYHVVVTNPPYMGSSNMSKPLSDFVKKHYPDSKSDLFAVFIERCHEMTAENGYQAMITQHAWMFLSSYEKLRKKLLQSDTVNMAHLGPRAFDEIGGEVVQTTSFVLQNCHVPNRKANYVRLIDYKSESEKEAAFLSTDHCPLYTSMQSNFSKIPGSPVAYWVSERFSNMFSLPALNEKVLKICKGGFTGNNDKYLRLWYEVDWRDIPQKWHSYSKGGNYRKWYGNSSHVIYWKNDGAMLKSDKHAGMGASKYYGREHFVWSGISSGLPSFRYDSSNVYFDDVSPAIIFQNKPNLSILGMLNSIVALEILRITAPTIHFQAGDIKVLPINDFLGNDTKELVEGNIGLSRIDWDSFETSWDFQQDPIVRYNRDLWDVTAIDATLDVYYDGVKQPFHSQVELAYLLWKRECNQRFHELKKNEEELNKIFIDIYGLQDELTPDVADKDVTVYCVYDTKEGVPESLSGSNYVLTKRDVVVNFISYAVGCMFGRYSLDREGLVFAGGDFDSVYWKYKGQAPLDEEGEVEPGGNYAGISLAKYHYPKLKDASSWKDATTLRFSPDADNVIPICDDEYFDDDITGRFVKFVENVFGADSLEDNLRFIADELGGKGTSREIIRQYFLKDFYSDHCKKYKKRPIYWLFDSGKKNGFKALIYMHRYQPDSLARMRTDYVHEQQERYRTQLAHIDEAIQQASGSERVKLTKQQKKLQDQSLEIQKYEEKIHHLADQNIVIDLDDGVKHNYAPVR